MQSPVQPNCNESTGGVNGKVIDDGGPVFPRNAYESEHFAHDFVEGISKRELFALGALIGICVRERLWDDIDENSLEFIPRTAYQLADAMLAASKGESNAK